MRTVHCRNFFFRCLAGNDMERIQTILHNQTYQEYIQKIETCELSRTFCRHNTVHFLDVARIAWSINLEEKLMLEKEIIYAAALLHDIGRFVQYETGEDHAVVSGRLAPAILSQCGFDDKETEMIVEAIIQHRNPDIQWDKNLNGIIYRADKLSRACYFCKAEADCNWKGDKKNRKLLY